jgi:hypothetical protein
VAESFTAPRQERPPYDKVTGTVGGWYHYNVMMILQGRDELETNTLFKMPRVEWAADHEFLTSFYHSYIEMWGPEKHILHSLNLYMLDCMRRDHQPGWLPEWPSIRDHIECQCEALTVAGVGHYEVDHDKERCSGSWGWDPPCGGCINCITAQAVYYRETERKEHDELPWWKRLVTRRPR